jgi:hypothetical protein
VPPACRTSPDRHVTRTRHHQNESHPPARSVAGPAAAAPAASSRTTTTGNARDVPATAWPNGLDELDELDEFAGAAARDDGG